MPYYEFKHAERLDDAAWKTLVSDPERSPAQPEWLRPLLSSEPLQPPARK